MHKDYQLLDAILRNDFASFLAKVFAEVSGGDTFLPNWHLDAIAWELEQILLGKNTRLIVTMPPRYLKSIAISVAWPNWMLGHNPQLEFVCVSYSGDLAAKHASDCRAVMQSDWYQRIFPQTRLKKGSMAEMDFRTTQGGGRLSTSVGGSLTGRGGDIIIIDDPIKPDEAHSETSRKNVLNWYSNTLASRLNNKRTGSIVLVMQRLHGDDLAGHLLAIGGWRHLSLPAIAETDLEIALGGGKTHHFKPGEVLHLERESREQLEQQRQSMGTPPSRHSTSKARFRSKGCTLNVVGCGTIAGPWAPGPAIRSCKAGIPRARMESLATLCLHHGVDPEATDIRPRCVSRKIEVSGPEAAGRELGAAVAGQGAAD